MPAPQEPIVHPTTQRKWLLPSQCGSAVESEQRFRSSSVATANRTTQRSSANTRFQKCDALAARRLLLVPISDEIRHEGGCCSPGNATRCRGPCSSALGPPHRADRGDRAQVLDQHPVDG